MPNVWNSENPKADIHSKNSNLGPYWLWGQCSILTIDTIPIDFHIKTLLISRHITQVFGGKACILRKNKPYPNFKKDQVWNLHASKMIKFWKEVNIAWKEKNGGYQNFLLSPHYLNELSSLLSLMIDWLNGVLRCFYQYFSHIMATIHIIHAFLGFTSTRLGSEVSCPRTLPKKTHRIQWGSNPGPLDYESNTLPLSHVGPCCLWSMVYQTILGYNNPRKKGFWKNCRKGENVGHTAFFCFSHNVLYPA